MARLRKCTIRTFNQNWFEMLGIECPICGKKKWCAINESQTHVVCMHVLNEEYRTVAGGTLYNLTGNQMKQVKINPKDIDWQEGEKLQPANIRHKVYSLVSMIFGLTDEHKQHLINERGLTEAQIALRGYFSVGKDVANKQVKTDKSGTIWEQLFIENGLSKNAWIGIPGFFLYEEGGKTYPFFTFKTEGIAIPCRNEWGQIISLQIRVDEASRKTWAEFTGSKLYFDSIVKKKANSYDILVMHKRRTILERTTEQKKFVIKYQGQMIDVSIKETPKYLFLSTVNELRGTAAPSLPHFAYSDEILTQARFDVNGFSKVNLFKLLDKKSVLITEGLLKGDIIISNIKDTKLEKLSKVVVSIAGVNVWARAKEKLKKLGVKRVISAFDQDFIENETVYKNMVDMITNFKNLGVDTYALTWEVGKGLDDCILSNISDVEKGYKLHKY